MRNVALDLNRNALVESQDSGRSLSSSPLQGVQVEEAERADAEDEAGATVAVLGIPGALPQGWRAVMDQSGQLCYIHPHHGVKVRVSTR